MLHILVSLCGLISCVSQHKYLLVHLSCHSITKTKQGPFTRPAPARSFSPAARRQPRGSAHRCSPPSGPTCRRVALLAPRGLAPTVVSRAELQSQIKPINFATKRKESIFPKSIFLYRVTQRVNPHRIQVLSCHRTPHPP